MAIEQESIQVGVIGAKLEVEIVEYDEATEADVIVDINTATTKTITIQRPDKTVITRTALFSNTGVDGRIYILTIAGDLTMEGTYYIQGYVIMTGWDGHSTIGEFEVHDNLG